MVYNDPDGELPILPLLLKAGSEAAVDMLMQASMAYFFDANVETIGQAFSAVNKTQVTWSFVKGLNPFKVPGGKFGEAALGASGDVLAQAVEKGSDYSKAQAITDFGMGFLADLGGGAFGDLVVRYGAPAFAKGMARMGFGDDMINKMFKNGGLDAPCPFCFTGETEVIAENGNIPIKDIKVGDMVLAYDEFTKEKAYKEVTGIVSIIRDTIYSVEVDGQVIEASSEHPFYVQGEWKETKNLDVGDKLTLFNQDCESSIASITIEARRDTVYNLSVADFETYFVSELGILVHNCEVKMKTSKKGYGEKLAHSMHELPDPKKMKDIDLYDNIDQVKTSIKTRKLERDDFAAKGKGSARERAGHQERIDIETNYLNKLEQEVNNRRLPLKRDWEK